MADKKAASVQVKVQEDTTLKPPIFVNQFRVLKEDNLFKLFISFNSSGQNLFNGLFVLNEQTCLFNQPDTVKYYERISTGFPKLIPASETTVPMGAPELFYGNYLECSHFGDLAQIRLVYISMMQLVIQSQAAQKAPVTGMVACIINLPLSVQMGIIKKVYF